MMHEKFRTPRKRRTCFDRLRARWLSARRLRQANPAASAASQISTLFVFLFGSMPLAPAVPAFVPYVRPPASPEHERRKALARRLGIPYRYVDVTLTQGTVPYTLLFDHVRRGGRSRLDAMDVLRQRAPQTCRDWLDHIQDSDRWSELLLCYARGGGDEDTDVRMLKSTLAWLDAGNAADGALGPADAETALTPGGGGNSGPEGGGAGDSPDDDPTTPRP